MDWIKKNYDQAALLFVALILLGMSAWLFLVARDFDQTFASISGQVGHNNNIPAIHNEAIESADASLAKPAVWSGHPGSLFVSDKYIVKNGHLLDPRNSAEMLHPPVPNEWFFDHGLDILDTKVLADDPDGDGFSNLDEFNGKTDPQNKTSHPPYLTKLRLARAIQQPFRLLFNAYDGDPTKPDTLTFQINTVDVKQPSQFLKLNDPIAGTKFKIIKFEAKKMLNSSTGVNQDVSELTVENNETHEDVVLVLEKIVNSPDSYALFKYLFDGTEFAVKKNKTFSLKQEPDVVYKLVDINDSQAVIENVKTNEQIKVPKLENP